MPEDSQLVSGRAWVEPQMSALGFVPLALVLCASEDRQGSRSYRVYIRSRCISQTNKYDVICQVVRNAVKRN